jgi:hypothetical protein
MRFFQTLFESQRLLNKIIYFNALPGVVIAGLIITSASAIFPIILIKKSSAAELIGDTL